MKLLLFSDVHCDLKQCQVLVELAEKEDVDFVIGAGDFANFRRGLEPTIEILSQISRPTIVGGIESRSGLETSMPGSRGERAEERAPRVSAGR